MTMHEIKLSPLEKQDIPFAAHVELSATETDVYRDVFEPPSMRADPETRQRKVEERFLKQLSSGKELIIKATLGDDVVGVACWHAPGTPIRDPEDEPKDEELRKHYDTDFLDRFDESRAAMRETVMQNIPH